MPVRDTFGILPPGTEALLYAFFVPFGIAFLIGLRRLLGVTQPRFSHASAARFLTVGILQRRVVRRAPGWAHAAIVFGFLALFAGTATVGVDWHYYRLSGARILAGPAYLYFKAVLDVFGALFVAGLLVALLRRLWKLREAGAEQRGVQRQYLWLLAGLLYMGCTGFVLEALRLGIHPAAWAQWSIVGAPLARVLAHAVPRSAAVPVYVGLWWSHAAVAFSLIASLPYTIFMHAIAAPVNAAIQRGAPAKELSTPFDLREIERTGNFDVKVGAAAISGFDPESRFALAACTNCGRCDEACPAVAAGTALSPRRLVQSLRALELRGENERDLFESQAVRPEEVWACTTCAACVEACPVLIRPVDYIVPLRRELVSRQQVDRRQGEFLSNLGLSGNPYGLPASRRDELAAELQSAPGDRATV